MNHLVKTLIIINPISGTGKQKGITDLLTKHLDTSRFDLHIEFTRYPGHGTLLAQKAIKDKFSLVVTVGGDGTINEIAKALAHSEVALGIIPCGSGNGLARHLNIPMRTSKAIKWLNRASIQSIDTIVINNKRFVNVAGIGFDALVAHKFAEMKSRGLFSYAIAVVSSFCKFEPQTFKITNQQSETTKTGMLISFANSSQFGNNAYIAPHAKLADGKMNISILQKPKWFQIPLLVIKIFSKKLHTSSLYSEITGDEFVIHQQSDIGHIDGEPVLLGNSIHLKLEPNSLKITR